MDQKQDIERQLVKEDMQMMNKLVKTMLRLGATGSCLPSQPPGSINSKILVQASPGKSY
jgi:hypothetical protein